jgi:hypothetical protein
MKLKKNTNSSGNLLTKGDKVKLKKNTKISKIPPVTCEIVYHMGLAVEGGFTDEQQRKTYGNATVDWLNKVQKSKEFKAFVKANWP